ncbi:metallophosphoesterase [Glycomyces sp. YM15]|uniref:metallophosphoesterase family protein n=1 Tax=Glycomyces sp. YM15 TaxID=2800446 RepID=UPI00196237F1|nr:metallophosphoesterase family protein [Glycomyces sp. YM15]
MALSPDRIALVSDVHGNLTAFQAVLEDLDARGVTRIFNLGDTIGKGPRGAECVDLSRERCEVHVQGNWEATMCAPDRVPEGDPFDWWHERLGEGRRKWLWDLPFNYDFRMSGKCVRVFHASAKSVFHRVFCDHDEAEFLGMFANTEATGDGPAPDVVGYGDIHDPYLENDLGRTLFNVGSVGNCLGDPVPSYVILEGAYGSGEPGPFSVQFVRVPYDVEAELAVTRELGMPSSEYWEVELRTGVYRGRQHDDRPPVYHRHRHCGA